MTKRLSAPEDRTGPLSEIIKNLRLTWRLLRDSRVPIWQKLIPPAALLYVLSPIDFVPDAVLGLGQLDDFSIILLGIWGFIQLCPQNVVQEHLERLSIEMNPWRTVTDERISSPEQETESPQVIDVEYEIIEDQKPEQDGGEEPSP
ncbi:MAG: DUF1232 domain-containing protein [Anaerolineae bacterium]|nr:DUF1232 domain-containing protein [Anaerolineae bacterium]